MRHTESNGKIEDKAPSEHLRTVSIVPSRENDIMGIRTPVIGLIGMIAVVWECFARCDGRYAAASFSEVKQLQC